MNVLTDEFEKISDLLNVQINKVEKNIAKRISNDSSSQVKTKENLNPSSNCNENEVDPFIQIRRLQSEVKELNFQLRLREDLIKNLEDTIVKKTSFSSKLKQDIFSYIAERMKCNILVKFQNKLSDLNDQNHKFFSSQNIEVDELEFSDYLKSQSKIIDVAINTDAIILPVSPKSILQNKMIKPINKLNHIGKQTLRIQI